MNSNAIETNDAIADSDATSIKTNENNHAIDNNLPKIETITDICNKSKEITAWCSANPIKDHVFKFQTKTIRNTGGINCIDMFNIPDAYIAGSYALRHLLDYLECLCVCSGVDITTRDLPYKYPFTFNWNSNDIDIFLLNRSKPARYKIGRSLDIISSPEKSVEELLIGFDLPVCRVAHDFTGTYYVSLQAMSSIITRKMNIPTYLRDKSSAYIIMQNHCHNQYLNIEHTRPLPIFLIDRFFERLAKYSGRGFGVNWINTYEVIEWIKARSAYAASRME